jgi:hypothetical protein
LADLRERDLNREQIFRDFRHQLRQFLRR